MKQFWLDEDGEPDYTEIPRSIFESALEKVGIYFAALIVAALLFSPVAVVALYKFLSGSL